jgi:hypothetical protein
VQPYSGTNRFSKQEFGGEGEGVAGVQELQELQNKNRLGIPNLVSGSNAPKPKKLAISDPDKGLNS